MSLTTSCNYRKFDKQKWNEKNDVGSYIHRNSMVRDLMHNRHLKGKSYNEVITLLGLPENDTKQPSGRMNYNIIKEHNNSGEPVHIKTLSLRMSMDSFVYKIAIEEMNKD